MLWARHQGASGKDVGAMAAGTDPSGNAFVTGYANAGLGGNTLQGTYDGFTAKYDPTGALLWVRQVGSAGLTASNAIATDASANVFVVGYTEGSLPGNAQVGTKDYWLGKYSAAGLLQ